MNFRILTRMTVSLAVLTSMSLLSMSSNSSDLKPVAPEIRQIRLESANVFLVKSDPPMLIDTGGKKDMPQLEAALKAEGVSIEQIKTILLTHGHADHAGQAAEIKRRSGATIVAGAGDAEMIRSGHNDDIKPTNLVGWVLKKFVLDPSYEAFEADLKIDAPTDLKRFGLSGLLLPMAGHTHGSLILLLADGRALVGDMMLGGWMGGALFAGQAGEHYFQDDLERNHANIAELLKRPIHTFYLGHGGPVSRASVLRGFGLTDPLADPGRSPPLPN